MKHPLIFTHLPRTGGVTLTTIFFSLYQRSEIYSFKVENQGTVHTSVKAFEALPAGEKKMFKVLDGHIDFGMHKYFDQYTYFTFFRDPVKRVISMYSGAAQDPKNYLYNIIHTNRITLKQFVLGGITPELNNGQTRQITNTMHLPFDACADDMLITAKNNIEKHNFLIGLTERYDESLMLLKSNFGWGMPFYKRANASHQSGLNQKISEDTLEVIRHYNKLDIALHEYAVRKFQETIDRQPPTFHKDLKRFKAANDKLNRLSPSMGALYKRVLRLTGYH